MDHTNQSTTEIIQRLKSSFSDCDELRSLLNTLLIMDHTNQSTTEIIQRLKSSFSDCDELRSLLNTLLKSLEKEEDDEFFPEVISLLLGSSVQVLQLDDVDTTLLEPLLPLTKNFLSKKLSLNHKKIDEESIFEDHSLVPDVLKNIEVCIQVLSDIDGLLTYLTSLDRIPASDLCSAPKNLAEVVYLVFSHCQKSKTEYKDVFSTVRSELMSLFQQCHQVQVKLFTLLNDKLVFNCAFEEEIQLLIDIIDILNLMSEVVAELDTMSLVAHWKGFAKLTQTYSAHLCSRLDVTRPITYLAVNIAHQLDNLKGYVNTEKKVVVRALKISSLQLKVLIKLCEHYKDHLGDCQRPLLSCLIALTARTPQSLSQEGFTAEVAAQVTTHLSAGAAPLLTQLLADPLFIQNYLQHADELQSSSVGDQFGYCNLTNMILKKFIQLTSVDDKTKDFWLKPTLPLIETTFKILHYCTDVFFAYEDDTYQTLLTHTAAFIIATITAAMFSRLERLLIKHLLQPSLWPALFTSDLLCLIARVGSSNLCLQLATLLRDLCSGWPTWDRCRLEWWYVSWTLSRITHFLAADDLKTFPSSLPVVTTVGSDMSTFLNKPFSDDSMQLYDSLMRRLTILSHHLDLFPDAKAALAQPVYQMWLRMTLPADLSSMESSNWFCTLFSVLVPITSHIVDHLDNVQIGNVLNVFEEVSSSAPTIFRCGACTFLRSLANKCFIRDSNQILVFNRVSSLFVKLMLDKNPLVKQIAFETFSYFAYVTKFEEIVASIVAKDSKLQNEITQYLKGVPIVKSNTGFLEYIASLRAAFVHKCKTNKSKVEVGQEDPELNPCKKFKTSLVDDSVSVTLQNIEKDLSLIKEFKNCSVETKMLVLKCISNRLDEMVKTS